MPSAARAMTMPITPKSSISSTAIGSGGTATRLGVARQAIEEHVDAAARRVEPRAQVVALVRRGGQLLAQQGIGALHFFMPQQQALDPVGEFFDLGHGAPAKGGAEL
jgi:hypothetical protein